MGEVERNGPPVIRLAATRRAWEESPVSIGAPCPACKCAVSAHPRSAYWPNTQIPTPPLYLVRGRCVVLGEPRPQKMCWLPLAGGLTVGEYMAAYGTAAPPMGPCPGCGCLLNHHGCFFRTVTVHGEGAVQVALYRGLCTNSACPVVTVTHYPPCITPYERQVTQVREDVLREHDTHRTPWESLAERTEVAVDTVKRWGRAYASISGALGAAWLSFLAAVDPSFTVPAKSVGAALWAVADRCARVMGLEDQPRLCLTRAAEPIGAALIAWPVWA